MVSANRPPLGYEEKFNGFIDLCANPDADVVMVHHPETIGDTYDEIVESLNRLADAGKKLMIVPRKDRDKAHNK